MPDRGHDADHEAGEQRTVSALQPDQRVPPPADLLPVAQHADEEEHRQRGPQHDRRAEDAAGDGLAEGGNSAAHERVERDSGHIDHERTREHDDVPEHPTRQTRNRRSRAPTPARPSMIAVMATAATTNPYPTRIGRRAGMGCDTQPRELAAAHRSTGHVQRNISKNPDSTGYRVNQPVNPSRTGRASTVCPISVIPTRSARARCCGSGPPLLRGPGRPSPPLSVADAPTPRTPCQRAHVRSCARRRVGARWVSAPRSTTAMPGKRCVASSRAASQAGSSGPTAGRSWARSRARTPTTLCPAGSVHVSSGSADPPADRGHAKATPPAAGRTTAASCRGGTVPADLT